jgi:diguanylate cyclase (GGDEF)-like protein
MTSANAAATLAEGEAGRQRLRLRRTLTAQAVYAVCIALQWLGVALGWATAATAAGFTAFAVAGNLAFYLAIRSGWSLRLAEPALTVPQMLFALVSLSLGYAINPHVRGALLAVVTLVLMFGAFTLAPAHCRRMGWAAAALLAAAMVWGMMIRPAEFPLRVELLHLLGAIVVLPTFGILAGELSRLRLDQKQQKKELREALRRLNEHASQDALTGLPNRRRGQAWFEQESARCRRSGKPLVLALIDLDHFKRINDEFGHAVGDEVLRTFASEAGSIPRDTDLLARWGGEEFLLLMPETTLADAGILLARLRAHLGQAAVWQASLPRRVTFAAGLAAWAEPQTLEELVSQADGALYEAKARGRDCVVMA